MPPTEKVNKLSVVKPFVKALESKVISIEVELITEQVMSLLVSVLLQLLTTSEELEIEMSEGSVKSMYPFCGT